MERFLSNGINRVDAKGRVSVPAHFRTALAAKGLTELYALQSLDMPAVDVGGLDRLERMEARMAQDDPFLAGSDDMSLYFHGDGAFLKLDSGGRITLSEFIRAHTGIQDEVHFVGRGDFFQMWEPGKFAAFRADVRERLRAQRAGGSSG